MSAEYVEADVAGLLVLVALVDAFWQSPTVKLAGEIRHAATEYGLSPISRRRLQWDISRVLAAQPARARPVRDERDPRSLLRDLIVTED